MTSQPISPGLSTDSRELAEQRAASVSIESTSENLFELRRLTGFSLALLADLLKVAEPVLSDWFESANYRDKDRRHIAETLKVLRFADRGLAERNSAALNERREQNEPTPFEAIRAGDYDSAKQQLSHGPSRPEGLQDLTGTVPWIGEFRQMAMHAGADGTEKIEPLPDEPEPESRKRQIRRR